MRALLVGMVIAVVICGGAGVLAFFRPTPNFGDSTIMLSKSNGTVFVRIGDRFASRAQPGLGAIDRRKERPAKASGRQVPQHGSAGSGGRHRRRPTSINGADNMAMSSWTVCDSTQLPSAAEQSALPRPRPQCSPRIPCSVKTSSGVTRPDDSDQNRCRIYLVYNGVRAAIDPADPILRNALRLADSEIREVSPGLLNSFPLVEPIVPLTIQASRNRPAIFRKSTGWARSSKQLIRAVTTYTSYCEKGCSQSPLRPQTSSGTGTRNHQRVGADWHLTGLVNGAPIVHTLAVTTTRRPRRGLSTSIRTGWCVCPGSATTRPPRSYPPARRKSAAAAQRCATSAPRHRRWRRPGLDSVYLKPGTGEYVQATGAEPDSRASGQLFYINDLGVRFHVKDEAAAAALGVVGVKAPGGSNETAQPRPGPSWLCFRPDPNYPNRPR